MLLNEHLSKTLFAESGIATPEGIILTPEEVGQARPQFPLPWVVKAQVLAGGRGKAGGVVKVEAAGDLGPAAGKIFDLSIKGHRAPYVRVEPCADIAHEFYLSFAVSRDRESLVMTASGAGGVDVESGGNGRLIIQNIDIAGGPSPSQVRAAFFRFGLSREHWPGFNEMVQKLYRTVLGYGLLLAEINPLVLTSDGCWLALDGKVEIDDNVRDMRPELDRFYESRHATHEENVAREEGLSFVKLKGWVGLLANGAGLAMATMDLLNFSGLQAANFLDLGGAADRNRMRRALELLFGDGQVEAVFINLFGGILSCESVALALKEVLGGNPPQKPIVARMAGNGAEAGLRVMAGLNLDGIHVASDMTQAMEALARLGPRSQPPSRFEGGEPVRPKAATEVLPSVSAPRFTINGNSKVLVQGITGKVAQRHVRLMQDYGTPIAAGVTPFKGGESCLGVPVYNSVFDACRDHDIEVSIIFVPAPFAPDAILEAVHNEIPWVICITEGISQQGMLSVLPALRNSRSRLIGPNTPGVIVPGQSKIGILPAEPFSPGRVAVFSRSGTLTYEASARLTAAGIGQSFCVGIGGDPFIGNKFTDFMAMAREDADTDAVLVLGEIGGRAEEDLAEYILETGFPKPVLGFVAGQTAPPGKRLGHAGAILEESGGGVASKLKKMSEAGIWLCSDLESIPRVAAGVLR